MKTIVSRPKRTYSPASPFAYYQWQKNFVPRWRRWINKLLGRKETLLNLNQFADQALVTTNRDCGAHTVPVQAIRGSVGRSHEYDPAFRPYQSHSRQRWTGIAKALEEGKILPPVELVQVADQYFVWDGHRRVSVARAMGQTAIDAYVTCWSMAQN